ncbi:hypothetical protein GCM10020254_46500 [Streptomyces goshikiensis]
MKASQLRSRSRNRPGGQFAVALVLVGVQIGVEVGVEIGVGPVRGYGSDARGGGGAEGDAEAAADV